MASTPTRDRISAVDTAWLRMDRPHNLMMICGVLMFRERLDIERVRALVADRFLVFPRFRQRPAEDAGTAVWEDDPRFDIGRHVVAARLPARARRRELQALVARLATTPLAATRPRWQFHVVADYGGGSAIVVRIHHCYADGIALVRVMMSMTDASAAGPPAMPFEPPRKSRRSAGAEPDGPLQGLLRTVRSVADTLIEQGSGIWREPARAIELAGQGTALTAEIAKLALMGQDSPTRFKGVLGTSKCFAWTDPLPLGEVKTIGRALRASVNDVLLSCVAGALGRYLQRKGDATAEVTIRALVPVNLRPLDQAYRLGNHFGLVFLDLPLGIANPVERLYAVRASMAALKGSYQPLLALGILAAMGAGPKRLQEALLQALARNASAVMTNVPGPQQPLWFAGCEIDSLMFWVPQSGDIGVGVSILSYNGNVQFGLVTDSGLCPDPEQVIAGFASEFENLVLTTIMAPWPRDDDLDPAVAAAAVCGNAMRYGAEPGSAAA